MKLSGLKNIRKIYGLTMRDLAEKMNVTANAVNLWESGGVDVPEYRLTDLSRLLRLDKQLFLKENHDVKDLMLIEIARAEFKIDEYKFLVNTDSNNIDKNLENIVSDLTNKVRSEENNHYDIKHSVDGIIDIYKKMPFEEYSKLSSCISSLIFDVSKNSILKEKFFIMYECLFKDVYGEKNNSNININNVLKNQIIHNIDLLYKIYKNKEV